MKIKCAPERSSRKDRIESWHGHFAIIPVKIGGYWYWLTTIERRGRVVQLGDYYYNEWDYRIC